MPQNKTSLHLKLLKLDQILKVNNQSLRDDIEQEESTIDFLQEMLSSVKIKVRKKKMKRKFSRKLSQSKDKSLINHQKKRLSKILSSKSRIINQRTSDSFNNETVQSGRILSRFRSSRGQEQLYQSFDPIHGPQEHKQKQVKRANWKRRDVSALCTDRSDYMRGSMTERGDLYAHQGNADILRRSHRVMNKDNLLFKSYDDGLSYSQHICQSPAMKIRENLDKSKLSHICQSSNPINFGVRHSLRITHNRTDRKENMRNLAHRLKTIGTTNRIKRKRKTNSSIMSSFFDKF